MSENCIISLLGFLKVPKTAILSGNIHQILNRYDIFLTEDEALTSLSTLHDKGDVIFSEASKGVTYVELSRTGGVRWESGHHPNWDRFLDVCTEIRGSTKFEYDIVVTCCQQSLGQEMIRVLKEQFGTHVNTISSEYLRPFHALYWKELPEGFEFRVSVQSDKGTPYLDPDQLELYSQWYHLPTEEWLLET